MNRNMPISSIRLSDKTSRIHPRHVVPKPAQPGQVRLAEPARQVHFSNRTRERKAGGAVVWPLSGSRLGSRRRVGAA